ncbi:MAG: metal-sulfur cluster assembly factor [Propionibacteriaceae bacterium]|jgi:metal-sulfur cluster biosynthetic enzyme|nr:metal-sulfur cluster assembly factor [Propionibacteriaceae bacterium]
MEEHEGGSVSYAPETAPTASTDGAQAPAEEKVFHPTEDQIREKLKDVTDPELGVNIVDLGLLYGIFIDDEGNVMLNMTLTTPTCPLTDSLEYDIYFALDGLVKSVAVNWVWLPPWSLDCITDDGREQLRAIGFNL